MRVTNCFQKQVVFLIIFLILESLLITDGICSPQKTRKNEFYPGDAMVITFIDINQQQDRSAINVSGEYAIDDRGNIMLPLIGSVKVIGYNRYTLAEKIVELYKPYFTEPYVTVTPLIRIVLMGPFFKPGSYRISPESSLWDLIDMAGGPQGECDLNSIKVIRNDEVVIEDLLASFEKGHSLEDIGVKSGDQIIAGNRRHFGVRELFEYLRFGMSLLSVYLLILRWQQYTK